MKDPVEEKSELVVDVLRYAHEHKLDIGSKSDVEKILEALHPNHSEEIEEIDEFMELLGNADTFIEVTAKEKEPEKTNLSN